MVSVNNCTNNSYVITFTSSEAHDKITLSIEHISCDSKCL